MSNRKKVTIFGAGYVGIAVAITLCTQNDVILYDTNPQKVNQMINGISPINDKEMISFFNGEQSSNRVTIATSQEGILDQADFIVIAVPTNWNSITKQLDISILCKILDAIKEKNSQAIVIIKSTLPLGTMNLLSDRYPDLKIAYVPEFLREGTAVKDEQNLSRLIIGINGENINCGNSVSNLFVNVQANKDVPVLIMSGSEAELVKLYSNAYLAMRVAFFNELDTYAEINNLDSKKIIDGISLDSRIGNYYNIPSFGYGGYCLPKDSMELSYANRDYPVAIIPAIIESNNLRKKYIADEIVKRIEQLEIRNPTIGIYRVNMKRGSDNCREAAILDIIPHFTNKNYRVLIYEPQILDIPGFNMFITTDLLSFKKNSNIILANRFEEELLDVLDKVYTRDTRI